MFKNRVTEILLITEGTSPNNEKNIYVSKDYSKLQYLIPNYINRTKAFHKKLLILKADKADGGDGLCLLNEKS